MNKEQRIEQNAFTRGLAAVDAISPEMGRRCRKEICDGFAWKSPRQALSPRANGMVDHLPHERKFIEDIFKAYGVTDPWGFA